MDDQKMWQWLREKRSQKELEGSGALPPQRGPSNPSPPPVATPEPTDSPWPTAASGAPDALTDDARQTLRAALEAFQKQQGGPPPRRGPGTRRGPVGAAPAAPAEAAPAPSEETPIEAGPPPAPKSKQEIKEALEYLGECLDDYERFVENIGNNGFTAPMTLYYRDEVQDLLDELTNAGVEMQEHWLRTVELDKRLHLFRQELVEEIGWANFKQYQIMNDPPPQNWWWFLNRETKAPPPPPAFWQFWKK